MKFDSSLRHRHDAREPIFPRSEPRTTSESADTDNSHPCDRNREPRGRSCGCAVHPADGSPRNGEALPGWQDRPIVTRNRAEVASCSS